jgi:N-carbamoyl-L-amino-acid hydrolase
MNLHIQSDRITAELETLASYSATQAPAVTRIVFSPVDLQARNWLKERCDAAGLTVREDAVGNTFARWIGTEPTLPAVASGSHIDAIPHSGRYDGTVGVLGALEAIRALQDAGFSPRRSIELILFTSEEPTRFGLGCLGSRLLSGTLDAVRAASLRDAEGEALDEVGTTAGISVPERCRTAPCTTRRGTPIEQGPLLEGATIPLAW